MKRLGLAATLCAAAISLSAPLPAQTISAEFPVSAPVITAADHEQAAPSVATNGEVFLVAWQNVTSYGEIYAARVSRDGVLLDGTPIPIAIPPRRGERPQVVWTGELFLVVWRNATEIRATKILSDGQIVGEESIGSGANPSISCTTTRCLVTWGIGGGGPGLSRVAARFLDSRGTPLLDLAVLPTFFGAIPTPRTATNGTNFLVTWQQFNANVSPRVTLYSAAVSLGGAVSNFQGLAAIDFAFKQHAVASDGSTYFVVWALSDGQLNRIEGQRLDGDGSLSGGPKVLLSSVPVGGAVSLVRISSGYLVVMNRRGPEALVAFRVTVDGTVLDPTPAMLTDGFLSNYGIGAAANSSQALVVWPRVAAGATQPDIYGAFVDTASMAIQPSFLVSRSASAQVSPAVATDGERIVTVWSEAPPSPSQIRTATLLPSGLRTDARPVHPSALDQVRPAIAFNGHEYLVAWYEGPTGVAKLMAKRLNQFGEPIGNSEVVLSSGGCLLVSTSSVAAASDGRDFVVAWDCQSSTRQLFATRVSDGVADAPRLIAQNSFSLELGGIAWGVDHYLLAWLEPKMAEGICDVNCLITRLQATRLSRAAEVLDAAPLRVSIYPTFARVAWDGSEFVAVWSDSLSLYAARVFSSAGTVGVPFQLASARRATSLAAVFDGASAAVTWTDKESSLQSSLGDIWMARVGFNGAPSSPPFQVSGSADDELAPAIAALAPGRFAVAYQRIAHEREISSANRVFVRTVSGCPPVKVDSISANVEIQEGSSTTLKATATGATAFQWYEGESGVTTTPLPGQTAASLGVAPSVTTRYWLRASNGCGSFADSATVVVTVRPCEPPRINTQPRDTVVLSGRSAELKVFAAGTSLVYQWYEGPVLDFRHPVGGNSPTLITGPITSPTQFWVRIVGLCGTVNSTAARVGVAARRRAAGP
jgi:hypothetical protein